MRPYWAAEAPHAKRSSPLMLIVGVGVAAIILVAFGGSLLLVGAIRGSAPETILPAGTSWELPRGAYDYIPFTLTKAVSISGSFTSTNGTTAYLLDPDQFAEYNSSGSAPTYYWTSGPSVVSGTVSTNLGAGSWYLVFENPSFSATTSLTVTSSIVAVP